MPTLYVDDFDGPAGPLPSSSVWRPYPWAPQGVTAMSGTAELDGYGRLRLTSADSREGVALWTMDHLHISPPFTIKASVLLPATSYEVWSSVWWTNNTGEVDVYENGGLTTRYQASVHEWQDSKHVARNVQQVPLTSDPRIGFRSYEARVGVDSVTFALDGVEKASAVLQNPSAFTNPGWVVVDLWPAVAQNPKGFPSVLLIDRIEVSA